MNNDYGQKQMCAFFFVSLWVFTVYGRTFYKRTAGNQTNLILRLFPELQIPVREGLFFLQKRPDRVWVPTNPPNSGYQGPFNLVKQPGREVNHSPTPSGEGKSECSSNSACPVCLNDMKGDNFTILTKYNVGLFTCAKNCCLFQKIF